LNTFYDVQGGGPFGKSSKKGNRFINKEIDHPLIINLNLARTPIRKHTVRSKKEVLTVGCLTVIHAAIR